MALSRLPADVIKRVLMPLLDFASTEALEGTCKGVHQSMLATAPRASTAYDCFKIMHRDVSGFVRQNHLNVEGIKYWYAASWRYGLQPDDLTNRFGKAFNYMRRFCLMCIGNERLASSDLQNVEAMYAWLNIAVPRDLRTAFARIE
jgi:hypothetical protein